MRTLIILLIMAGIIVLQVFLSKRKSKWLGLILPSTAFLFGCWAIYDHCIFGNLFWV